MSCKKADEILPHEILRAVQIYIDGESLYIPRKDENKRAWGANTETKERIQTRNREILHQRMAGSSVAELSEQYFLSAKAIYKILASMKKS